jgi:hypothetical protein
MRSRDNLNASDSGICLTRRRRERKNAGYNPHKAGQKDIFFKKKRMMLFARSVALSTSVGGQP